MTETPPPSVRKRPAPLDLVAIVLAVVAALLLLGAVLFAFATASAGRVDGIDRFRLLGQAASPVIALLALAASAVVVHQRRVDGTTTQVAAGVALSIGTTVGMAVALLALNGIVTDLVGDAGALFTISTVISRTAAVGLSGLALWLSATAPKEPS